MTNSSTHTAKVANTRNGWAIALITDTYRDGTPCFEVARVSPTNAYVILHRTGDYSKARTLANREWIADKGQTVALPTIPCAQSHNTWNPDHEAHDWLCKQQHPSVDARCPGSLLDVVGDDQGIRRA